MLPDFTVHVSISFVLEDGQEFYATQPLLRAHLNYCATFHVKTALYALLLLNLVCVLMDGVVYTVSSRITRALYATKD